MIFTLDKKEQALQYLERLFSNGNKVEIKGIRKRRSLDQNAYFHGVVCGVFGLEFGYSVAESKELFKTKFLRYEKNGEHFTKETSSLNTIEFEDFLTKCRMFSSEQGCFIPLPNEVSDSLLNTIESASKYL
jgi:hypothetical protein